MRFFNDYRKNSSSVRWPRRHLATPVLLATFCTLALAPTQGAMAQGFTFTNLVDSTMTAPGGGTFENLSGAALNNSGIVAFTSHTTGDGNPFDDHYRNVYRYQDGNITRVFTGGEAAPGGGVFDDAGGAAFVSASGSVFFLANAQQGGLSFSGIWRYGDGFSERVIARGEMAPGGGSYGGLTGYMSVRGENMLFQSSLTAPGPKQGIYLFSGGTSGGGSIQRLIATGDAATDGGTFFSLTPAPEMNAEGQMTFWGETRTGGPGTEETGLYVQTIGSPETLRRIAHGGDPAPGGGTFAELGRVPTISSYGAVSFNAGTLDGPEDALYLWENDTLVRLVAVGEPAPGGGGAFTSVGNLFRGGDATVFTGSLPGEHNRGLYHYNDGTTSLIIRSGDSLFDSTLVSDSDSLSMSQQSVNDRGQFVFSYLLSDGRRGFALASPIVAPEPGSLSLLGVGGLMLAEGVQRRRQTRRKRRSSVS